MELLKNLTNINSPSGNEEQIRDFIKKEISDYVDEIKVDYLGNIIAHKNGSGEKLVLSAHMDEVGFLTMIIDEKGFIRPRKIGNVNTIGLHNSRVALNNNTIGIINLISAKNIENSDKITDYYIDNLKVCNTKDFTPCDYAAFYPNYYENEEYICSKSLSSRSGCYALIKLIKEIKNHSLDLYFVFSVQGEIGFHCCKTALYSIKPDYAINIECIESNDGPKGENEIKLNYGPVIKIMDKNIICNHCIKNSLIKCAKELHINTQFEISDNKNSDAGSISTHLGGIATGAVSIPCRNLHSSEEVISKKDLKNTFNLLKKICEEGF